MSRCKLRIVRLLTGVYECRVRPVLVCGRVLLCEVDEARVNGTGSSCW